MAYQPDTHCMRLNDSARARVAAEVAEIYGLDDLDEDDCGSIFLQLEIAALKVWPQLTDDGGALASIDIYSITGDRDANVVEAAFADFLIVPR